MSAEAKEEPLSRLHETIQQAVSEIAALRTPYGFVQTCCTNSDLNAVGRALMKDLRTTTHRHAEVLDAYTTELKLGEDEWDRAVEAMRWLWAIEGLAAHVVDVAAGSATSREIADSLVCEGLDDVVQTFTGRFVGPIHEEES